MTKFQAMRKRWKTPQPCSPKELLRRKWNAKLAKLKRVGAKDPEGGEPEDNGSIADCETDGRPCP